MTDSGPLCVFAERTATVVPRCRERRSNHPGSVRPGLCQFAAPRKANEGASHSALLFSLLSPLCSFLAFGRSGLRPSLVQGLRPRNAPPLRATVLILPQQGV